MIELRAQKDDLGDHISPESPESTGTDLKQIVVETYGELSGSQSSQHPDSKVITSRDADISLKFLRRHSDGVPEISAVEEKTLSRKILWIIVPLCSLVDFVLYADKATASYTSIFGMWKDTHMTQDSYNNSTTLFYVGYIVGQVNLIFLQKFPVGRVMTVLSFVWALLIFLHSFATTYRGVYALRFFLGFVEAIAVPALNTTMGQFLTAKEKSWTAPLFYTTCLGNDIIVGFIAFGLLHARPSIAIWKLFMIVIGGLSLVVTILVALIYPNNPTDARFLSLKERVWVIRRVQKTTGSSIEQKTIKFHQIKETLKDPISWLFCAFFFCNQLSNNLVYQEKLLYKQIGVSTLGSTLVSVAYGGFSVSCGIVSSILIRKVKNFTAYSVILWTLFPFVGSIAVLALPWEKKYAILAMICLCAPKGVAWILMFSWNSTSASGYTKKMTRNAMVMFWYGVANIIAPQLWQAKDGPRYYPAWIVQLLFAFILAPISTLAIRVILAKRNKERSETREKYLLLAVIRDDEEDITSSETNLALLDFTDLENKQFIYPL
ncbi:LAMI_0C11210g1_1 [Lachancea mirantina]|uniref:LAMI_0C11210g1_1 n=1 Tax=Lachancea mirantina TaxID=1230905 RepID=A0A1G4J6F6_9SACH|nr:LAMI_0C11210g1_1 [Lachancea mirantina]